MSEDMKGTNDTDTTAERLFMDLLAGLQRAGDPADTLHEAAPGVATMRLLIVNVAMVEAGPAWPQPGEPGGPAALAQTGPGGRDWVLVDAGLPGSARPIMEAARRRFAGAPPRAIVLTHGHFDHVGALDVLLRTWDVPVYAHEAELPYLTGREDYVRPDPSVDPGLMAKLAPLYPRAAIDLGDRVQPLPQDGLVPGLPDWRWLPTPGHTPGHVCLFRVADRVLIVGDAFTTVRQESAAEVARQEGHVSGPPKYFTPDWRSARLSVEVLAGLEPEVVVPSHGPVMRGDEMRRALRRLASEFDQLALPPGRQAA